MRGKAAWCDAAPGPHPARVGYASLHMEGSIGPSMPYPSCILRCLVWLPMMVCYWCLVPATCADKSYDEVTKFAKQSGVVTLQAEEIYSCARAKKEGVCALPIASQFCPVTCDLCKSPAAWTWLRTSNQFCLSSLQRCDPAARCGDLLASAEACHSAAVDLGLTANMTVLQAMNAS